MSPSADGIPSPASHHLGPRAPPSRHLVSRMAVSWCSGWSSPFVLMFFCHLQKLIRVSSAWCVIFRSSWANRAQWSLAPPLSPKGPRPTPHTDAGHRGPGRQQENEPGLTTPPTGTPGGTGEKAGQGLGGGGCPARDEEAHGALPHGAGPGTGQREATLSLTSSSSSRTRRTTVTWMGFPMLGS